MCRLHQTLRTLVILLLISVVGCSNRGPVPINYGQDECDHCKMTIADKGFGSELITAKGKAYKFDSIECLAAFCFTSGLNPQDIHSMWVSDFSNPGSLVNVDQATIIASERQKSPMGVGLLAVGSPSLAPKLIEIVGGKVLPWDQVIALVAADWKLSK